MREKKLQCVVTFSTTTQAMAFEEAAKKECFLGRLIPLPRTIGAGCGLAWREDPTMKDSILHLMTTCQLEHDTMYEIMI